MATSATSDLQVRPATDADAAALIELLGVQLREHGVPLDGRSLAAAVGGLLRRPQLGRFLVAIEGDAVVGFAALSFLWTLEHGGRSAWLDEIYVMPEQRNRGIGLALLRAAYREAGAVGAVALDLEIERGRERVTSLYEREGFRRHTRERWVRPLAAAERAAPTRAVPVPLAGGCLCGGVRYRLTAPPTEVAHCHCSMCRRASGAPVVTWATVARSAYELTSGSPVERVSSPKAARTFCGSCGTALTFREIARPDWIDVTVASLDAPERLDPDAHIFTASRLSWLRIDDDLPRHPGGSPADESR